MGPCVDEWIRRLRDASGNGELLRQMNRKLSHRGPDLEGYYEQGQATVGPEAFGDPIAHARAGNGQPRLPFGTRGMHAPCADGFVQGRVGMRLSRIRHEQQQRSIGPSPRPLATLALILNGGSINRSPNAIRNRARH